MHSLRFTMILLFALAGAEAMAQGAQEILETARDKQVDRWKGVNSYSVVKKVAGQQVTEYYQRFNISRPDGGVQPVFQSVSAGALRCDAGDPAPVTMEQMREQLRGTGAVAQSAEAERMRLGDNIFEDGGASPLTSDEFIRRAKLVGSESVDGRDAWRLRVDDVDVTQQSDGNTFTFDVYDVWIDKQNYVPLRGQMEGTAESGGETRDIAIDVRMSDYRDVAGSDMYESYSQRLVMTGMIDAEQQAQLRQAEAQLSELEQQMASMPESQRKMMESMMGDQLQMLRDMADGGAFDMTITVQRIVPNSGPTGSGCAAGNAADIPPASLAAESIPAASPAAAGDALTAGVQRDLSALGYDTGNTDGVMVTETIVAISQFQAENDMDVTGEVTPQLAGILGARTNVAATVSADPAALQAAQQACLQQKIEAAQESSKKKRGFGRLMSAVGRTAGRIGGDRLGRDIAQASRDLYDVNATADDLSAAARDLGISESDIEACRNPQ